MEAMGRHNFYEANGIYKGIKLLKTGANILWRGYATNSRCELSGQSFKNPLENFIGSVATG